ncbi:MAG: phosphatidate cytidylyltransferase [Cypionkella sp.]
MTADNSGAQTPPPKTSPTQTSPSSTAVSGRWGDLGLRVVSGLALAGGGVVAVWLGGTVFLAVTVLTFGLMAWELASLTDAPANPLIRVAIAALAGAGVLVAQWGGLAGLALLAAPAAMAATSRREWKLLSAYLLAILISAVGIVDLDHKGAVIVVWMACIVVVSDVMGYFAGRLIGGPLFWPAISPKKTWSGTIAGWLGAAVLGAGFAIWQGGSWHASGWGLVYISPLVAMAGQAGDIVESLIKRRAGVKDASRLIPGHGGVLDRFDALIGAILLVQLLQMFMPLPLGLPG